MKVTFCTYDDPNFTGGPNSWLRNLLPTLRQVGIESEVLFFINAASASECPCFVALSEQGFPCYSFPMQSTTQQQIQWILSHVRQSPPDVFVPNLMVGALYASHWIKEAGIPTVGVLHSDDDYYRGIAETFIFGQAAYQLSAVVCVSEFLVQMLKRWGNTRSAIAKIPCGVPLPAITARKPTETLRIVYLGRLVEEQKQVSKLTTSLCRAIRSVPNTEAFIFGDGSAKANVETILASEGKGLPVYLGGLVDNTKIQDTLAAAHVLVLLSDYEGLPIALMEAMACGVVPVCLNIRSGISELVEHDVTGLLVNDREDDFVAAIERIANEAGCWERLSHAARAKVRTSYSNDACADAWVELLSSLQPQSPTQQTISLPKTLHLPPVHPALTHFDRRPTSFWTKATQGVRRRARAMKRMSLRLVTNSSL